MATLCRVTNSGGPGAATAWRARLDAVPVPHRWLAALLAAALLMDAALAGRGGPDTVLVLPGAALTVVMALVALYRPGWAALGGAASVLAASMVIRYYGLRPTTIGDDGLLLSEIMAGAVLTVLVAWRGRGAAVWVGIPALVVAGFCSVLLRQRSLDAGSLRSMAFGFLVLSGSLAVAAYLRRSGQQLSDSRLRDLARRQWPLAGALSLLLFLDLLDSRAAQLPLLLAAVVVAGCACLAPLAPVRATLVAAVVIASVPMALVLPELVIGGLTPDTMVLTEIAGGMALVAFVTRYARAAHAIGATAALVVAVFTALDAPLGVRRPGDQPAFDPAFEPAALVFLLVVSIGTGLYFRSRDADRDRQVGYTVTSAKQAERLALARELHDVVAHHVTGIVVQAQAARLVADRDPDAAARALERIETSGTDALTAMRLLVGSMRGTEPAGGPVEDATTDLVADLRAVAASFGEFDHGPRVDLRLDLPSAVPQEVGRSVLRLVQESLTNVVRHAAGATVVVVEVDSGLGSAAAGDPAEMHVRVSDDGAGRRARPAAGVGGYGLIGMRERVELLGGTFGAGPTPTGWRVEARLPLRPLRPLRSSEGKGGP